MTKKSSSMSFQFSKERRKTETHFDDFNDQNERGRKRMNRLTIYFAIDIFYSLVIVSDEEHKDFLVLGGPFLIREKFLRNLYFGILEFFRT